MAIAEEIKALTKAISENPPSDNSGGGSEKTLVMYSMNLVVHDDPTVNLSTDYKENAITCWPLPPRIFDGEGWVLDEDEVHNSLFYEMLGVLEGRIAEYGEMVFYLIANVTLNIVRQTYHNIFMETANAYYGGNDLPPYDAIQTFLDDTYELFGGELVEDLELNNFTLDVTSIARRLVLRKDIVYASLTTNERSADRANPIACFSWYIYS